MEEEERIIKEAKELYNQASIAYQKNDLHKANQIYEKLIAEYPPKATYYLAYILFLFDEEWTVENVGNNYCVAIEVCRNAIENVPIAEHYYFYIYQAKAIEEYADYSGEKLSNEEVSQIPVLYRKAISLYPNINEGYIYLLSYYLINSENNVKMIEESINKMPSDIRNDALIKNKILNYYFSLKQFKKAIDEGLQLLEIYNSMKTEDELLSLNKKQVFNILSLSYKQIGDIEKHLYYRYL